MPITLLQKARIFLLLTLIGFSLHSTLKAQHEDGQILSDSATTITDEDTLVLPFALHAPPIPPRTFGDKMRNAFMSKKFKTASVQRDSMYREWVKLHAQYVALQKNYEQDTAQRTQAYKRLLADYRALVTRYDSCKQQIKDLRREYVQLADDYRKFRESSLSAQDKLKMAIAENDRERAQREAHVRDLERLLARRDSAADALRDVVRKTLLGFKEDQVAVNLQGGRVYVSFSDKFLFESGSAQVTNPDALSAVALLAKLIAEDQNLDILIEGHTDSIPIRTAHYKDNWDLSAARAIAVTRLVAKEPGVDPKRLTAAGRSWFVPKDSNTTPEGRAQNRRTEIILIPNLSELYDAISAH